MNIFDHDVFGGIAAEKNAHLITELLEACKALLFANAMHDEPYLEKNADSAWKEAVGMAEKAIAKAEGRQS